MLLKLFVYLQGSEMIVILGLTDPEIDFKQRNKQNGFFIKCKYYIVHFYSKIDIRIPIHLKNSVMTDGVKYETLP